MRPRRRILVNGNLRCTKCKCWYPMETFNKNKTATYGRGYWCNSCKNANRCNSEKVRAAMKTSRSLASYPREP